MIKLLVVYVVQSLDNDNANNYIHIEFIITCDLFLTCNLTE